MKANEKHKAVARIARRSLMLVGLLVASLCFAGPSRAQSSATPAPAAAASGATQQLPGLPPSASASTPRPVSATGPGTAAEGKKGPKGRGERVKVLGYWKIEVHDPDGKLVSHTEFENSLTTGGPNGVSGDFALAELLGGSHDQLFLAFGTSTTPIDVIATGYAAGSLPGFLNTYHTPNPQFDNVKAVISLPFLTIGLNTYLGANNSVTSLGPGPCNGAVYVSGTPPPPVGCVVPTSQALNTSPGDTTGATGNQIVLSSSFQAQASSTISQVSTYVLPVSITIVYNSQGQLSLHITEPESDAGTGQPIASYSVTSASLSAATGCAPTPTAPCAVYVTQGQTIAVTVTLSFQ